MPSVPQARQRLDLVVKNGPLTGRRVAIDRPLLLGRDPRCRIVFDDNQMSRLHALIEFDGKRAAVRDLGSVNGVHFNGVRIQAPQELRVGDSIRIGQTDLGVQASVAPVLKLDRRPDVQTSADATGEYDEASSSSGSDSGVLVQPALLARALEFASQCSSLTRSEQVGEWLLPRLCQVFESLGSSVAFFPRDTSTGIAAETLARFGEEAVAKQALTVKWSMTKPSRASISAAGIDHPAMAVPLMLQEGGVVALILWRAPGRAYQAADEHLSQAIGAVLIAGSLAGVLDGLAARGLDGSLRSHLGLVGESPPMVRVREEIRRAAATNVTVLITGESGSGKEVAARALVALSPRAKAPFIALNMGAIPTELAESELFGHEKGAFSGAHSQRAGKLELAHRGTLFLDEIGDMSLDLQAKLLRVLEGHPFYRIGGSAPVRVDVRFICATHRQLEKMVERKEFRADLFHRMNILRLAMPPLRERIEDLPELVGHLLRGIQIESSKSYECTVMPRAIALLMRHEWPGNVRELRNVLEQMVVMADGRELDESHIPRGLRPSGVGATDPAIKLQERTSELERREIVNALIESEGIKMKAAQMLGISRPTLDRKIKLYRLEKLFNKSGSTEAQ